MTLYRVYTLNEQGKIDLPAQELDFADDGAAVEKAKHLLNWRALEVWEQARLIVHLEPKNASRSGVLADQAEALHQEHHRGGLRAAWRFLAHVPAKCKKAREEKRP